MSAFPLTNRRLDALFFWRGAEAVSCETFLRHVAAAAAALPDRPYALNLCDDRYLFLVAFAACLCRGQVSLLTSERSPSRLGELASRYAGAYTIGTKAGGMAGLEHVPLRLDDPPSGSPANPQIPGDRAAAIVFTSGSTGTPVAHTKPWGTLVTCSLAAAARFGLAGEPTISLIGTVPPQHMYGFETTVLLPLHANVASYAGTTFFPTDVGLALQQVTPPRLLVTTPLQLRALLTAPPAPGMLDRIISATAPLSRDTARAAEAATGARILEIYGATEVGSIASRRTVEDDAWEIYASVSLSSLGDTSFAAVPFLADPVPLNDHIDLLDARRFRLLGRRSDLVKLAGKRASLAGLNKILCDIDGVEDGVFVVPEGVDQDATARLTAFVVAPGRSAEEIMAALKAVIEPTFLPRRIVLLEGLPRNEVGKLPHRAVTELQRAHEAPG